METKVFENHVDWQLGLQYSEMSSSVQKIFTTITENAIFDLKFIDITTQFRKKLFSFGENNEFYIGVGGVLGFGIQKRATWQQIHTATGRDEDSGNLSLSTAQCLFNGRVLAGYQHYIGNRSLRLSYFHKWEQFDSLNIIINGVRVAFTFRYNTFFYPN